MLHARALVRAGRSRRVTVLTAVALVVGGLAVRTSARRRADLHQEVRWLRARLAEKRDLMARQRQEMAEVVSAVDRVAQAVGTLRDQTAQARRLAHMEQSHAPVANLTNVSATLDGGMGLISENAALTLQQLSWLEGQTAAIGDSIVVLTALLKEEASSESPKETPSFWPVRGAVTSRFGVRRSPYGDGREMHPGIDIRARHGVPVTAGGDGKVAFAGRDPGYGGLVIIRHGGELATLYGHLSALYVREGQTVRRGQPIGAVGATGRATGNHLHYEVRLRGAPVNPHKYLVN